MAEQIEGVGTQSFLHTTIGKILMDMQERNAPFVSFTVPDDNGRLGLVVAVALGESAEPFNSEVSAFQDFLDNDLIPTLPEASPAADPADSAPPAHTKPLVHRKYEPPQEA